MEHSTAYNQSVARETAKEQSKLQRINNRFIEAASSQSKLIYEIQDKLHNILNLREPEKTSQGTTERAMANSFVDQMHENISQIDFSNDRLRKVLEHINRII